MTEPRRIPAGYLPQGGLLVKHELAWNPEERTATLIRSVYAGVSGPHGEATDVDSREAAERFAFDAGLIVCGDWTVSRLGEHYAPLTTFKG